MFGLVRLHYTSFTIGCCLVTNSIGISLPPAHTTVLLPRSNGHAEEECFMTPDSHFRTARVRRAPMAFCSMRVLQSFAAETWFGPTEPKSLTSQDDDPYRATPRGAVAAFSNVGIDVVRTRVNSSDKICLFSGSGRLSTTTATPGPYLNQHNAVRTFACEGGIPNRLISLCEGGMA